MVSAWDWGCDGDGAGNGPGARDWVRPHVPSSLTSSRLPVLSGRGIGSGRVPAPVQAPDNQFAPISYLPPSLLVFPWFAMGVAFQALAKTPMVQLVPPPGDANLWLRTRRELSGR